MRARPLGIAALSQCILERSAQRGGPLRLVSKTTQKDVERKAAAGAQVEAELVQHRDFLPLWLDPSEFNEDFDNALHPPVA